MSLPISKLALMSLLIPSVVGISQAHADTSPSVAASAEAETALDGENAAVFVEAAGTYGFQLGSTPYVPDGNLATYKSPLTQGYSGGITAGIKIASGLYVTGNYDYTVSSSRDGEVEGMLEKVTADISYQTLALGLRSTRNLGPGTVYAEVGLAAVLPLETEVNYHYMPGAPVPKGTLVNKYKAGYGAQAALGYQVGLGDRFYAGTALKLKAIATSNEGKTTKYTNVIEGGNLVNTTIKYEANGVDGAGTRSPSTYSVQDIRLQFNAGVRF